MPALASVWRAAELGAAVQGVVDTGYAALNPLLPGGGWPQGSLIELLQPQAGLHEWGLLAPALAALQQPAPGQHGARMLVLVGAPHQPFGPALGARALQMQRLLCVQAQGHALLWAAREALKCADVAGVLAWLPDARSAHLRCLQIAAHAHHKLLCVFRPLRAAQESSPAPLRLQLEGAAEDAGNLWVRVLKRRGPPLELPVLLDTRPARLAELLAASRVRRYTQNEEAIAPMSTATAPATVPVTIPVPLSVSHALLDRPANLQHH